MDCETFLEACRRWNELATGTLINGKAPAKVAKGAKGKKRPAEVSKVLEVRGYERELQYLCELDEKSGAKPQVCVWSGVPSGGPFLPLALTLTPP